MYIYHIDLFNNIIKQTHQNIPVSLSKRSPLSWAGFSDEGTPCTYDYSGVFRLYRQELGKSWVPILNLRDLTTSALDHYFVVGVNELSQSVKAVRCKRSRFPEFTAETAEMLAFSLPMCSMDTDKGKLEEEHVRLRLAESTYERIASKHRTRIGLDSEDEFSDSNYNLAESALEANEKLLVNNVLRLFAMCLKEDKEDMAKSLVYMIPKAHMSKLAEFAWKIQRPQYFIDSINRAIEEREQIDLNLIKPAEQIDDDDARSVNSSHHNFGRDLKRELGKSGTLHDNTSPNKLRPLTLDKLASNNVNKILEGSSGNSLNNNNNGNNKRQIVDLQSADDSGDENDVKRATKRSKTSNITHNLFSKKARA